ncbi:MAG TPA: Tex family protein [Thermotogota bacterium]|jgi:uncharacterized protein|nr:MAG: 30S ribosomal protein S1 [Thermotogota bacterium ADurb.Bin062]HNY82512.1 Tex family protein [Thermotogota bacterium]HOD91090.1 Tex family protein [Thermotogota bacterium]HOF23679.1 Tex family protein [Thermotogota bacterium]HOH12360.1 Tex family protein [Thermotogota bacterium]
MPETINGLSLTQKSLGFDEMLDILSKELGVETERVRNAVYLLDEEKTIAFIARYRKEATQSLNEIQIRQISERIQYLRRLKERKEAVENAIREQGKWQEELDRQIAAAMTLQEVENLYFPFKKHKKTKADVAREKGLAPLSDLIKEAKEPLDNEISAYLSEENGLLRIEDVMQGVKDILREEITFSSEVRTRLYELLLQKGIVETEQLQAPDPKGLYRDFYRSSKSVRSLEDHRILAMNRGEKAKVIRVKLSLPEDPFPRFFQIFRFSGSLHYYDTLYQSYKEGFEELLFPSVVRQVRNALTEKAQTRAIEVFAHNLRHLLLVPPLRKRSVLGIDPGLRTGCKCAVIDSNGMFLDHATIYPHAPHHAKSESEKILSELYERHPFEIVAIGNGTASRETEAFVADWIAKRNHDVSYLIVSEAGASVYSASENAVEEFPELDVTSRGAISIARRVQDPLAELVKIPPESIGVGMYQHDLPVSELNRVLKMEVESVVNYVGVDLNQASPYLLQYVSGLNRSKAWKIHEYKTEFGFFRSREDLKNVKGIGEKTYELAAGFCRIPESENPLDNTVIHPESYERIHRLLKRVGSAFEEIGLRPDDFLKKVRSIGHQTLSTELQVTEGELKDYLDALTIRHLDPRDSLPQPLLKKEVRGLDDLGEGMELEGTVRNVVDFGAFVDIGVEIDGLIHQSQFGKRWVKPSAIVHVGEIIRVRILKVDKDRGRINLAFVQKA